MTTMMLDHKANDKRKTSWYEIDRTEYPTLEDLRILAGECMNDNVYLIRAFENGKELFTMRNSK